MSKVKILIEPKFIKRPPGISEGKKDKNKETNPTPSKKEVEQRKNNNEDTK